MAVYLANLVLGSPTDIWCWKKLWILRILPLNWKIVCVGLLASFLYAIFIYSRKPRGIPPGPDGLPLVGYSSYIGLKPHETFTKLSKQYGNVFSLYIGSRLTIILSDYEAVKAAYLDNADAFSDRDPGFVHREINSTTKDTRLRGLTMTNGDQWKTMRRFALTTLRNLGMGKSVIQELILAELEYCREALMKEYPRPVKPEKLMLSCIANILFSVTFNKRFNHGDPEFQIIIDYLTVALPTLSNFGGIQVFPWLRYIPGKFKDMWTKFTRQTNILKDLLRREINTHEYRPATSSGEFNNYADAFFAQQDQDAKQGNRNSYFDNEELVVEMLNLFVAGSGTTSSAIRWAYYFLALYPDIQKKVQETIDQNVSSSRMVTVDDKVKLAYVEAFCLEVQRMGSLLPLSTARSTSKETMLLGYRIPKRSFILPNLWYVHRDPTYWERPEEFKPERFLNKDGGLLSFPYFMPFSVGKRQCPAEPLAKMELFLFVTNIVQKFRLEVSPGYSLPLPEEGLTIGGLTNRPPPYEIIFKPRDMA